MAPITVSQDLLDALETVALRAQFYREAILLHGRTVKRLYELKVVPREITKLKRSSWEKTQVIGGEFDTALMLLREIQKGACGAAGTAMPRSAAAA